MYSMQVFVGLLAGVCLLHVVHALAPSANYESYGPNQVFQDEGQPILSGSGRDFVAGNTKQECARTCYRQNKCTTLTNCECNCCNSFAYKGGSDSMCYLKKRDADSVDAPYTHPDGFQSFKFFPLAEAPFYTGDLPETVRVETDYPYYAPFQSYYSTKGDGQVAKNEGSPVFVSTSIVPHIMYGVSASQCATECEALSECEGFSYHKYQQGGQCYFKTGLPQDESKYETVQSEYGWTFYWKESDTSKCYCSCETGFFCLHCLDGKCCEIEGRTSC
eukprot:TRINITY_DN2122_c2_g1_i1.p3 TRINITY_DN2122_c2_g1~~TRINITY_DN2122_c2_g1_i1.p3  ORF type:complete len:275 (-),score=13.15 TRINITY_DN2122_c2_g1_i1:314-1138(-)